ncbi:MAG: DNA polymerase III subunit delta [Candidatus Margulisiibacteriota bacterium]
MIHLIYGDDTAQIEEKVQDIRSSYPDTPFEKIQNKITLSNLFSICSSCDMFSSQKGYIVYDPNWLKKAQKDELELLKKIIEFSQDEATQILIICKSIDKRSAAYKQLKKSNSNEYICNGFKDWEEDKMVEWLQSFAKSKKISIATEPTRLLLNAYGNNLGLIKKEIEKIGTTILPKTTIESADLTHAASNAFGHYNQLSKSINEGHIDQIIKSIHQLMTLKEDPHKILNQLLFQLNNIIPIILGMKNKLSNDTIAKKLNKHPFFIKKQMQTLQRNTLKNKLISIIPKLAMIDKELKQGKLSGKQCLIKLCTELKH